MPIGAQSQGAGPSRARTGQGHLRGEWEAIRLHQQFVDVRIGFGRTIPPFLDASEAARNIADALLQRHKEKGPAIAQVWFIEEIAARPSPFLRSVWHTRTIWITLHRSMIQSLLASESSAFLDCMLLERVDIPQLVFKSGIENLGNVALALGADLLTYEPAELFDQEYLEYPLQEENDQEALPVLWADPGAIQTMAEAQEEEEAATQAELRSSRVSYRLVRRRDSAE
jgi:hypothetical protein